MTAGGENSSAGDDGESQSDGGQSSEGQSDGSQSSEGQSDGSQSSESQSDESQSGTLEPGTSYRTQGRTITEADIINFAGVSGDFNHLHTNEQFMADTPVGERVAHGSLVFAVATGLLWQSHPPAHRERLLAFYGVDRLRFVEPVYIGDTISVRAEIIEREPADHPLASGLLRQRIEVFNQNDAVVQAADFLLLVQ